MQALDAAVRADLRSLRIIHGKGTGALRERVAEMLQKDTRVRGFRTRRLERRRRGRDVRGVRVIPDDVVERVRDEADIVSIIGEFVKLKRVGNSFRGPVSVSSRQERQLLRHDARRIQVLRLRRGGRRLHASRRSTSASTSSRR